MESGDGGKSKLAFDVVRQPSKFAGFNVSDTHIRRQSIGNLHQKYLKHLRFLAAKTSLGSAASPAIRQAGYTVEPPLSALNPADRRPAALLAAFAWEFNQLVDRSQIEIRFRFYRLLRSLREKAAVTHRQFAIWWTTARPATASFWRDRRKAATAVMWAGLPAILIGGIFALALFLPSTSTPSKGANGTPKKSPAISGSVAKNNKQQESPSRNNKTSSAGETSKPSSSKQTSNQTTADPPSGQQLAQTSAPQSTNDPGNTYPTVKPTPTSGGLGGGGYTNSTSSPFEDTGSTDESGGTDSTNTSSSSSSSPSATSLDLPPLSMQLGGKQLLSTDGTKITLN